MSHVLLTGATGLLGSYILPALRAAGHNVTITTRSGQIRYPDPGVTAVTLDLENGQGWQQLPSTVDVVIHSAALIPASFTDLAQADRLWQVNGLGTLRLLQWAKEHGACRFIYISSHSVYARPYPYPIPETHATYPAGHATPYALSKLAGELFATSFHRDDFQVCSLRLPTLFGPGMAQGGILSRFIHLATTGQPIHITAHPDSLFDFLYVANAVQAVLAAVTAVCQHTVYNIGSGQGVMLPELATAVWSIYAPKTSPQISVATGDLPVAHAVLDITHAKQDLQYQPVYSLSMALHEMKSTTI